MRPIPPLCPLAGSLGGDTGHDAATQAPRLALFALAMVASLSLRAQTEPSPAPPALQAAPPLQIAIDGGITATDNGGLSPSGQERGDLIATVRPKLVYFRRTSRLEVDLAAAVGFLAYARGTQDNAVLPELRALARAELIERWLHLDVGAEVEQAEISSYGSRVDQFSTANRQTATSFNVSPYVMRELSANTSLLALYGVATTNNGADTGARLLSQRAVVRLERKPVPVGAALEIARLDNETEGFDDSRLTIDTARAAARIALRNQMILGAVAGVDRSENAGRTHTDPLYGATLAWNPGPGTALDGTLEHRFFGFGGSLVLRHRTPSMSFAVSMRRGPVAVTSTLGQVESDLRPLLDAILTSRYPDPAVRRGLVQSVVGTRALDVQLPDPTNVVAGYSQLQTDARATWAYLGTRNTAALTLYMQKLQQLTHDGDPPPAGGVQNDSRQAGASFQVGRRLSPTLSVDAVLSWSKITGLALRAGQSSEEWIQRIVVSRALSPRTAISAGLQHNDFSSNATGQHDYDATLAFVGLRHSF